MFQNGTNWMDGTTGVTQCPVPPGKSFLYNFTIDNQFGTYWYHAHASTQYIDGIVGPLIIHAPEEVQTQQQYDFDQVILLQDWYHDLSSGLTEGYFASGNENAEPVPDNGLIQGENYFNCSSYSSDSGYSCTNNSARPVFSLENDKRYRLRFINTGAFTTFQVSVDNHTLDVIEADGTLVSPLPIHRFEIATAQRYSVILHANQSSSTNYWLRAQMNEACYAVGNDVLDPMVLALITYTNTVSEL
jgi:FtsP/CotA-like multicopper oxidase with cupredoxin domain